MYQILELLSLDDLCLCSRTCKHFQTLCENHFNRKYPNVASKNVEIVITPNGKLLVSKNQKHVKYFQNFIKNLIISAWDFSQKYNKELILSTVVNFVKAKCSPNLRRICIDGDFELAPLCMEIAIFLRNVEIVQFKDREKRGQDEATFLKNCPNLTKLILSDGVHVVNVDEILQQKYHQLTHFYYVNGSAKNLNAEKLKTFFQMNNKIQYVALKFDFADDDRSLKCIQTLDNAVNLEHLFLSIGGLLAMNFNNISDNLKVLCERDRFKSLEIECFSRQAVVALELHSDQLANLKQLTKIHLSFLRLSDMIPALLSMIHLKIVVMDSLYPEYNLSEWSNFDELIGVVDTTNNMALPQVEEVHFGDIDGEKELLAFVMLFVRHWTNLNKILVPESNHFNTKFDIIELNRARIKLENACELTVFTSHNDNETNLDHKLVKLKFVQFESVCDRPFEGWRVASEQ